MTKVAQTVSRSCNFELSGKNGLLRVLHWKGKSASSNYQRTDLLHLQCEARGSWYLYQFSASLYLWNNIKLMLHTSECREWSNTVTPAWFIFFFFWDRKYMFIFLFLKFQTMFFKYTLHLRFDKNKMFYLFCFGFYLMPTSFLIKPKVTYPLEVFKTMS